MSQLPNPLDIVADGLVALYGLNQRTWRLRGGYRLLKVASKILPKLRRYPIHFPETSEVYVDVNEPDIYWLLNDFVGHEHPSARYFDELAQACLEPGDVVWDVGGSMGTFSSRLAQKRFRVRSIHLFEPHPSPMKVARGLLEKNPVVHLHPFALGKERGSADLHFTNGTGGSSLKSQPAGSAEHITCKVEVGDLLLEEGVVADPPNLIKIDVEGFEPEVIAGLQKTILTQQPVIFWEILFITDDVLLKLVPEGYRIAYIRDKDGKLLNDLAAGRKEFVMDAVMAPRESKFWRNVESMFIS